VEPSTHRVNEHIGGLQMCRGLRMTCAPPFEPRERVSLLLGAADLNERMFRDPAPRGLHARWFVRLLLVVRRPRRVAQTVFLMPG
jgi:hypothetical protein